MAPPPAIGFPNAAKDTSEEGDKLLYAAKSKAERLWEFMHKSDKECQKLKGYPGQSEFTCVDDLAANGWFDVTTSKERGNYNIHRIGAKEMFDEFEMRDESGPFGSDTALICIATDKNQYSYDGKNCCDSEWINAFNVKARVIVACANYSPDGKYKELTAEKKAKFEQSTFIPKLKHWSDIVYLQWLYLSYHHYEPLYKDLWADHVKCPRGFLISNVSENDAKIIHEIKPEGDRHPWSERMNYDSQKPHSFALLLGTQSASAVAYFLIQHKEDFGNTYICRITLFDTESGLQMLLRIDRH